MRIIQHDDVGKLNIKVDHSDVDFCNKNFYGIHANLNKQTIVLRQNIQNDTSAL